MGDAPVLIDDLWKAAAYGDLEKLEDYLKGDPALANKADGGGYYAVQWAALNNRVAAATILLERGADVNATDGQGQTALHWAAVRGALPTAELLLRSGARLDKQDSRGYTAAHVAAQYGHTAVLYHFKVRWDADEEVIDSDGRTPLHWAAYKGFADSVRLLLFLDSDQLRQDREGCTPLHWAAIKGNAEAVYLLTQSGGAAALAARDNTGSTPAQLAQEKNHSLLAGYLSNAELRLEKKKNKMSQRWLSLCTVALIMGLVMLFINTVVHCDALPREDAAMQLWAWTVVTSAGTGLLFMYRTAFNDPGVLSTGLEGKGKGRSNGGSSTSRVDLPALWAGHWGSLCVSCKIVRPLGSKHCGVMNKCVSRFDHYCPWVGNAIGKANIRDFIIFLVLESIALVTSMCCALYRVHTATMPVAELFLISPSMLVFLVCDGMTLLPVLMLTIAQVSQVGRNITTNELANMHRYPYLRHKDGRFQNPFDKGCSKNCTQFFLNPLNRDKEIEYNMGAPLLEAELTALLSGGQISKGSVSVDMR